MYDTAMRADQQSGTIAYLVTRDHRYTMDPFIADFGLDAHFDVIPYDEVLCPHAALPEGTVIFSDVDRLAKRERHAAIALADRLLLAGRRVLNHPANVFGRVELLRRLKLSGINPFSLYRLVELANVRSLRYPVFVRTDSEHSGSLSPLIRTPLGLAYWILRKGLRRRSFADLLVVEYEDVVDPATGVFRKYSYLKIGETPDRAPPDIRACVDAEVSAARCAGLAR